MKYDAYRSRLEHEERRSREDAARSAVQHTPVVEKPVPAAGFNKSAGLSAPPTPQIPPAASPEAPPSAAASSAYAPFSFQTLKPKQKKAFSLIGDLSHPDFMRPIEETANALYTADRKKRPKKAQDYVGYDFTKILQEALNDAGIPDENGIPLRIDGIFGPKTESAFTRFQTLNQKNTGLEEDARIEKQNKLEAQARRDDLTVPAWRNVRRAPDVSASKPQEDGGLWGLTSKISAYGGVLENIAEKAQNSLISAYKTPEIEKLPYLKKENWFAAPGKEAAGLRRAESNLLTPGMAWELLPDRGAVAPKGATDTVYWVQKALGRLGYSGGDGKALAASGRYDQDTQSAVRAFQALRGLNATGLLDRRTFAELQAPFVLDGKNTLPETGKGFINELNLKREASNMLAFCPEGAAAEIPYEPVMHTRDGGKSEEKKGGSYAFGSSSTYMAGPKLSFSAQIVWDEEGNIGLLYGVTPGGGLGLDVNHGFTFSRSDAPSIDYWSGVSPVTGGSVSLNKWIEKIREFFAKAPVKALPVSINFGYDKFFMPDGYSGDTISFGAGKGFTIKNFQSLYGGTSFSILFKLPFTTKDIKALFGGDEDK